MNTAQDLNWENDFDMRFGRDSYDNTETILDSTAKREDILDFIRTLLAEQEKKWEKKELLAWHDGYQTAIDEFGTVQRPSEKAKRAMVYRAKKYKELSKVLDTKLPKNDYGLAGEEEESHD